MKNCTKICIKLNLSWYLSYSWILPFLLRTLMWSGKIIKKENNRIISKPLQCFKELQAVHILGTKILVFRSWNESFQAEMRKTKFFIQFNYAILSVLMIFITILCKCKTNKISKQVKNTVINLVYVQDFFWQFSDLYSLLRSPFFKPHEYFLC